MADTFESPLHDTYPVVVSKLDPLVIRVSDLVLLVGSTTYTAKVKMGQMFNGYHIYVSSLGTPIYKQVVDISGRSTDSDNNRSEGSDAWRHIAACARTWMDDLEKSMTDETAQKNVVELLREMKFQEHFDMSGHIIDENYKQKYGDNFELCTEQPVYMQDVVKGMLGDTSTSYKGLNDRISDVETKLEGVKVSLDEFKTDVVLHLGNLTDKLSQLLTKIDTTNSNLTEIKSATAGLGTSIGETIADAVQTGLENLVAQMNAMNTNITIVDGRLTDETTGLGAIVSTVTSRTNSIQSTGTIYQQVNAIRNTDVVNIMNAIGSSGGDISGLVSTVNTINNTVNRTEGTVNSTYNSVAGIDKNGLNNIAYYLGGDQNCTAKFINKIVVGDDDTPDSDWYIWANLRS